MTLYLLDESAIQEMRPGGDANVRNWLATVSDHVLRVSAITFFEKRRGWERQRRKLEHAGKDTADVDAKLKALDLFEEAYAELAIVIDQKVVREWTLLLGAKDKNEKDMALAATARVHGLVVVTRNVKDFEGRDVRILNPFVERPQIRTV